MSLIGRVTLLEVSDRLDLQRLAEGDTVTVAAVPADQLIGSQRLHQ